MLLYWLGHRRSEKINSAEVLQKKRSPRNWNDWRTNSYARDWIPLSKRIERFVVVIFRVPILSPYVKHDKREDTIKGKYFASVRAYFQNFDTADRVLASPQRVWLSKYIFKKFLIARHKKENTKRYKVPILCSRYAKIGNNFLILIRIDLSRIIFLYEIPKLLILHCCHFVSMKYDLPRAEEENQNSVNAKR